MDDCKQSFLGARALALRQGIFREVARHLPVAKAHVRKWRVRAAWQTRDGGSGGGGEGWWRCGARAYMLPNKLMSIGAPQVSRLGGLLLGRVQNL